MSDIEINKELHRIALNDEDLSLQHEIATWCIEDVNPAKHLRDIYRDKGIKYDFNSEFYYLYVSEIHNTISDFGKNTEIELTFDTCALELSYIACQLTIQELLLSFGSITDEDKVF